jgi:acyl-CoA synthetase (AMP-forming)/AMP-acid ligase II
MLGYFDDQQATEAAFNAQGWFMTGDLGWILLAAGDTEMACLVERALRTTPKPQREKAPDSAWVSTRS